MKYYFILLLSLFVSITSAQQSIGIFESAEDIGNPKIKGSSIYDPTTQSYTLTGGGENIWFNNDEFHFLYKKIKGDFLLTANFELVGNEDGNGHRKTGWMIRQDTATDAISVNSCLHGDGLAVLQWRPLKGAFMRDPEEEIFFPKEYYSVIQLERNGKNITMRLAHPGEAFQEMGTATVSALGDEVLVGPYVLAHDPDDTQEARIWNVRISKPVVNDFHPNPLVKLEPTQSLTLGSRMELLDISTGSRKVIYESTSKRFSSPSFQKNGKQINFVQDATNYSLSIEGGDPVEQTGKSNETYETESDPKGKFTYFNDNRTGTQQIWRKQVNGTVEQQLTFDSDHDWYPHISPDGKWIVYLSYAHDIHPKEAPSYKKAILKLMPTSGGAPRVIAYLYGGKGSFENPCWSPDSKHIVFVSNNQLVESGE